MARFSNLPEALVSKILTLLPAIEVRTKVMVFSHLRLQICS